MSKLKTKLFSYLTSQINIGKLDELTNWLPLSWLKKFFIQSMITYDFPQHVFIETTSACNLKCKLCPRTSGKTLVGHMDFELFKKIVDEANQYGPRTFCLHLFGEPLLAPKFIDEINYIKKVNSKNSIVLTTNGTLLNEKIARAMIQAPVDKVTISFMSTLKNIYADLTGVDALDLVEKNVKRLIKLKKKFPPKADQPLAEKKDLKTNRPKIIVRLTLEENNQNEIKTFKNKWKNSGVIIEIRSAHNYGGNIKLGKVKNKKIRRWPCYHLWLSPAIHWNGDFSVCCVDYARKTVLGNVKDQTVNNLWNSKPIRHFRRQQLRGYFNFPPICEDCDVWKIYKDIFFKWQKK